MCANATGGRGGPTAGQTALRSFDLKTGAAKGTYPFPDGGPCNDVAIAADGTAYASDTMSGRVLRLKPGAASLDVWVTDPELRGVAIQTSLPFSRPDGLRTSGPKTLLQVEGQGRLTEITIDGDHGDVRVVKDGLTRATGVTQIGATALVLVEQRKAVVVPMAASNTQAPAGAPAQQD